MGGFRRFNGNEKVVMDRKEFLKLSACAAAACAWEWDGKAASAGNEIVRHDAPPRNRRPYTGVDWSNALQIRTTTHGHCDRQSMLDAYMKRGFEFLTVSNYYPSAPRIPLNEMHQWDFRVKHDFPVMVNGKRTDGPFDWNKIVAKWKDTLADAQKKEYPFTRGKKLFKPLPPGILEAPNAEHHFFRDENNLKRVPGFHMCSPGSAFSSGTFDARNRFKTHSNGWCFGSGEPWPIAVDRMLAGLVDPAGGGVTVNHPTWSKMTYDYPCKILDYDPRVLGMEVITGKYRENHDEDYWDYALRTGRQCFGFFVPDWQLWTGCNVLLVKEKTVEACLRAYREGNFYGAIHGDRVKFTNISYDGRTLEAATDKQVRFQLISGKGKIAETTGTGFSFKVPATAASHVYFRLKAFAVDGSGNVLPDDKGEVLFSQPFMV